MAQRVLCVTKASGETEPFDADKLHRTCLHAGATPELADKVVQEVNKKIYNGISTRKILEMTVKLLHKEMPHVAARYDLKGAIMRLGPAGFAFEELFAEILRRHGYSTTRDVIVQGACVDHEIDVIAERFAPELERAMIESKYHNQPGVYTGLKEALYTWARFYDLQEGFRLGRCKKFNSGWLVTNTKFSDRAIHYAGCKRMVLVGWSFPHERSLKHMLEDKNLYPITILLRLDKFAQMRLAAAGFMLCEDLVERSLSELRRKTGLGTRKLELLVAEAKTILEHRPDREVLRAPHPSGLVKPLPEPRA